MIAKQPAQQGSAQRSTEVAPTGPLRFLVALALRRIAGTRVIMRQHAVVLAVLRGDPDLDVDVDALPNAATALIVALIYAVRERPLVVVASAIGFASVVALVASRLFNHWLPALFRLIGIAN